MKTNLVDVIDFLKKKFSFINFNPIENSFELYKSIRLTDSKVSKKIKNSIVLLENFVLNYDDLNKYEECLIIVKGYVDQKRIASNYVIDSPVRREIFNTLMINNFANEPYGIDEMSMIRWDTLKSTFDRVILGYEIRDSDSALSLGYGARIGISGDFIYCDLQGHPHEMTSIGGVRIGKNVIIGPNVVIYRGLTDLTEITDNTIIEANVIIHGGCKVSGLVKANSIIENRGRLDKRVGSWKLKFGVPLTK